MENFEKLAELIGQKKTAIIYCRASNNDKVTKQRFICTRYCYANNIFIGATVLENISSFRLYVRGCKKVEEILQNQGNGIIPEKIDYLISVEGAYISPYRTHKIKSLGVELIDVPGYDPILENKDTAIIYMTVDKGATDEKISEQKSRYLEYCRYNSIRILDFIIDRWDDYEDDLFSGVIETIKEFNSGPSKLITKFIYNDCFKGSRESREFEFTPNMFESFGIKTLCIDECNFSFMEDYYAAGDSTYFGYDDWTLVKEDYAGLENDDSDNTDSADLKHDSTNLMEDELKSTN